MTSYRPYKSFTAHGLNVSTLNALYRRLGDPNNEPSKDLFVTIIVFLAFSIESYINHLGAGHLSIWDELERLPWRKKITILHKINNKEPNWGAQPLQFAKEVFTIRDKLAHGKPETVRGPLADSEDEAMELLKEHDLYVPEWEKKYIDLEWIVQSEKKYDSLIDHFLVLFRKHEIDSLAIAYTGVEEVKE
ncbi:MAG: hypothetical protein JAY74_17640 [Candidatus Thiodiazotropha taylori]|nr:hypothetical protein [Candidatus Thiodiazotropha taylori]